MVEPGEKEWPVGEVDQGRTRARPLGLVQCVRPPAGSPLPRPCPSFLPDVILPALASCPGHS